MRWPASACFALSVMTVPPSFTSVASVGFQMYAASTSPRDQAAAMSAGSASMISRAVTKGEYQGIEDKFGGLRANMPAWYGFKFWYWNSHTKLETLYAIIASFAVAVLVHLFALGLIGVAL